MESITYTDYFSRSERQTEKVAKLAQEKIAALRAKGKIFFKPVPVTPVVSAPATPVAPVIPSVAEPVQVAPTVQPVMPNIPVQNVQPTPSVIPQVVPNVSMAPTKPVDIFQQVTDTFNVSVYKFRKMTSNLAGARKIKVNKNVLTSVSNYFNKQGNLNIDWYTEPVVSFQAPPVQNTPVMQNTVEAKESVPSVDDYLQKESLATRVEVRDNQVVSQEEISKLSNNVEALKAEAVKKAQIVEELKAKYDAIVRAEKLNKLHKEELEFTQSLEGLDKEIEKLSQAIAAKEGSRIR